MFHTTAHSVSERVFFAFQLSFDGRDNRGIEKERDERTAEIKKKHQYVFYRIHLFGGKSAQAFDDEKIEHVKGNNHEGGCDQRQYCVRQEFAFLFDIGEREQDELVTR